MAVIEIAKIQVRRGQANQTGLPQLDSGEFGWAVDTQKLYIGNGSIDEGAPTVGNTEILTEHTVSNLFNLPNYSYKGNTASSPVQTGPLGSGDTFRTYQEKLDDIVSLADFGIVGDGNQNTPIVNGIGGTPVYQQIQTAIDTIFNNSDKLEPRSRKKLFFPAGTYAITGTIYIPPYTTIVGDGPDKTVLEINTSSTCMQFKDVNGVIFEDLTTMDEVHGVSIDGITFKSTVLPNIAQPLLKIDCGVDCQISQSKFSGIYTSQTTTAPYTGIEIRGQGAVTTENLLIQDSVFDSLFYAIKSNYDISNIVITNNKFNNLYKGIVWTDSLATDNYVGPYRSKITHNTFANIRLQGIYVGANPTSEHTDHVSAFNSFSEVGNNLLGDLQTSSGTSIIKFLTLGNTSVEDKFERDTSIETAKNDTYYYTPSIEGSIGYQTNVAYTTAVKNTTVSGPTEVIRLPYGGVDQNISLKYSLINTSTSYVRKGNLSINPTGTLGGGSTTATVTVVDNYTYSAGSSDIALDFAASIDITKNTIKIVYTALGSNPGSGQPVGQLKYQFSYLR
jgi:hypothetical protein